MTGSEAFAKRVLESRRLVATALFVVTLVALAGIYDPIQGVPRIRIDPSLNEMLPADDPARLFYEELLDRFGSDDVVLVALIGDDLFTKGGLAVVEEMARGLSRAEGVHHVEGLTTAVRMRPVDDDIEISGFFDDPIESQAMANALREEILSDPLRAGTFVSKDGRATAMLVTFERMPEDVFLAGNLDLRLLEVAREAALDQPTLRVILAGTPHVKAEVGRLLTGELVMMIPVVIALMGALGCAFFRSVRLGMVPLAAVGLGLVWTIGTMGWVGHDLNIVTTLIPPLVLALGFAYSAHVVSGFAAEQGEYDTALERSRRALAHVAFPVTFTALTTAAGFLSLTSNGLEVIRGFGIFAVVSTAATLLAALTLVPLLLSGAKKPTSTATTDWLDRQFTRLAAFDARHVGSLLALGGVASILAIAAATRIEVNLPVIENFGEETAIRQAYQEVDALFGGANQFYVMLEAEEKGAFERPEWLREVRALQTWLEAQPEIGDTTSVVEYIEVLNEGMGVDDPPARRIPDSRRLVAQLLLFGANEELDVLLDRAHQVITIMVRSTATETREFDDLASRIDERLGSLPNGITGHATGNAILLTRAADRIARGQALSLVLAVAMIGVLLVGYFRSLRLGLFALLPNLLPLLFYFGLLGATGTTLNNSTALMGSIVLGVAVDDTLHLLVEYRRALRAKMEREEALRVALVRVGRAITCTTMAVCLGLLVVGTSGLQNQAEFGLLGAATLALAWLVDVTITPALCLKLIDAD